MHVLIVWTQFLRLVRKVLYGLGHLPSTALGSLGCITRVPGSSTHKEWNEIVFGRPLFIWGPFVFMGSRQTSRGRVWKQVNDNLGPVWKEFSFSQVFFFFFFFCKVLHPLKQIHFCQVFLASLSDMSRQSFWKRSGSRGSSWGSLELFVQQIFPKHRVSRRDVPSSLFASLRIYFPPWKTDLNWRNDI